MPIWQRMTASVSFRLSIGLAIGALLAFAGFSLARAATGDSTTYYACVAASGTVRVVQEGEACRHGETPISWNNKGPQGDTGPAGPQGPQGDTANVNVNVSSADQIDLAHPTMYLTLRGQKQGDITGSSTQPGHEGQIEVFGWNHEVLSPRDAASGLPTGKRQHKPFTITKELDKSTPLLYEALVTNENIPELTLSLTRTSADGSEEVYYTVKLTNASISDITTDDTPSSGTPALEHVSFTYQKITWTWQDGGITAEDDWETPVS